MKRLFLVPLFLSAGILLHAQNDNKQPPYALRKISSMIENEQTTQTLDYAMLRAHLPEMITIAGGSYSMGCTAEQGAECKDERPPQQASVGSFKLSKTEVTAAQYCAFLNAAHVDGYGWYDNRRLMDVFDVNNPIQYINKKWQPKKGLDNNPMVCITWFGADAYCRAAGGRLPTSSEWEYAARGGAASAKYRYAGGNTLKKVGWHANNSNNRTHPVATLEPNELGLYDMSGNVWEWCSDIYTAAIPPDPDDDDRDDDAPQSSDDDAVYVLCGGCWYDDEQYCRVSFRDGNRAADTDRGNGFRMAMD
jgi:formylglycine-generating enzyme required for sulfatase activity